MKRVMTVFIAICIAAACILMTAHAESFSSNPEAVNQAAKSVMTLYVMDDSLDTVGSGSGFVAFSDRYLLTNWHVIEDGSYVVAVSDDGDDYLLTEILCVDSKRDLCILLFSQPSGIKPLELSSNTNLLRAAPVVAIGSPRGYANTVSIGNVSGQFTKDGVNLIQFTAPISHGSSGGALFDDKGQIIGITTLSREDAQNLNFAVSIEEAVKLMLISGGNTPVAIKDWEKIDIAGQEFSFDALNSIFAFTHTPSSTPTPTPTPTPKPTPTPTPTPAPSKEHLTSVRFDMSSPMNGSVRLQWDTTGKTAYFWYEYEGCPYCFYGSTEQNVVTIDGLIPGQRCTFGVTYLKDSIGKKDIYTKTITIPEGYNLTTKGFQTVSNSLFYVKRKASTDRMNRIAFQSLDWADFQNNLSKYDFYYEIYYSTVKSVGDVTFNVTIALFDPDGKIYVDDIKPVTIKALEEGKRQLLIPLNGLFTDMQLYSKGKTGNYKICVCINGNIVMTRDFRLK